MEDTTDSPEPLLDAREVADWLGIAASTVYERAASGVLPHVRLWRGKRRSVIRFRRSEIEQMLQERAEPSRQKRS